MRVAFDGNAALPERLRARRVTVLFRSVAGVQVKELSIVRRKFGRVFFHRGHKLLEGLTRNFPAAKHRRESFVRDRAEQLHAGVVRRGCRRLIHERDPFLEGSPFFQPKGQVTAAQRFGAAEIDASPLIIWPRREHLLELGDAVGHGLRIAREPTRVKLRDLLLVRRSGAQRRRQEQKHAKNPKHHRTSRPVEAKTTGAHCTGTFFA